MKNAMMRLLLSAVVFVTPLIARARVSSDGAWVSLDEMPSATAAAEPYIRPNRFHAVQLNPAALTNALARAPRETAVRAGAPPAVLELPLPDGGYARFHIAESPVMAPGLAKKFPEIRTYIGTGIDDPAATARLDWTPAGFHAQVRSPKGGFFIDPFTKGDIAHYASYRRADLTPPEGAFECLFTGETEVKDGGTPSVGILSSGDTLRTYRLAVAASGEYSAYHGGTVASALAAIVTAVNRVTGVYETELGIRFELVTKNTSIIYLNRFTDPYTPAFPGLMLSQNQSTLDSRIGNANYDIGHVFSTGGGGLATLACVCKTGLKAQGLTGSANPVGDPFWIDFVAHEIGHQFGANHTFNGTGGSCSGANRNAPTAYEPGSGSTIMAYAGICGASDNLQPASDPYFHFISYQEIFGFINSVTGGGCAVVTPITNLAPTVSAGPAYTIPRLTPFMLAASGSDPDGDPLTYCWEQRDLGPAQAGTAADNGSSPLIRSFNPTSSPNRIVPRVPSLVANTNVIGEKLPSLPRAMKFRVTARDNRIGAGVAVDDVTITVVTSAGPFLVTAPNSAVIWSGLSTAAWDRANTHLAPVNCASVNIWLSTNGGFDFTIPLALNVSNSGSRLVWLPAIAITNARLKVEAADNIFFDISNTNFTIAAGVADSDGDGIADAWEYFYFTNLTTAESATDFDGDGASDRDESLAGTDPKDPASYLRVVDAAVAASGSGYRIQWTSESNRLYTLSRSTNLLEGFAALATNLPATPPVNIFTDPAPPSAIGHYRIDL